MAKVTNILAGDGYRGDISDIISTTTKEEKKKLREKFYKDLIDNAVAVPVGIAEGAVGLPGDIEGLARGAYRAYNAEDGDRLEAFGSAFADTTLPSTQQIQDFTNEYLLDNEFGEMVRRGKYGRLAGEFLAPASVVTAPGRAGVKLVTNAGKDVALKGAGALSDSKFFQKLANPLDVDVQPSMFIGEKAKNFPHEALGKAKKLESEGKTPQEIWEIMSKDPSTTVHDPRTVSLGKDVDGFWKAEVDDSGMTTLPIKRSFKDAQLKDILSSKDNPYFDNYPLMAKDKVVPTKAKTILGQYRASHTAPEYKFTRWFADNQKDVKAEYERIYNEWKQTENGKKYLDLKPKLQADRKAISRYWSSKNPTFSGYNEKVNAYNEGIRKLKELKTIDHPAGNINELNNRYNTGKDLETGLGNISREAHVDLGVAKHELGHGVQHNEGWGRGSSKSGRAHDIASGEQNSYVIEDRGLLSREERAKHFPFQYEEGNPYTYKFPLDEIKVNLERRPRLDSSGDIASRPADISDKSLSFMKPMDDVYEPFPEPTREVFEFTKGSGNSKGGPVSITKDISVPYQSTKKVLPPSDNPFRGPVHSRYLGGRLDNGKEVDSFLGHEDPLSYFKKPKAEPRAEKAVEYLQPKENITRTTGISPARAERLAKGEIMPGELPNHTVDKAWARSTEKPYDTTQFIRDTKGNDGDFFARLARDNSREYTGMFDVMPYSNDIHTKTRFENVGNPEFMTPHTGKFVQDITTPDGNYAKLKLGSVKGANAKSLQTKVDTAVDIANNKQRYATTEDRLDAFVDAMEKIEAENAKHVSRGKPTKVKDDAMNYLWQIHDDLQREAMLTRYNLMPQRTVTGERMFNDVPPVSDRGTGEVDWDEFMQDIAENSKGIL